ncbi:MAG: hypothetical protein ACRDWE_01990 [Acidimicrobiales bacterium]
MSTRPIGGTFAAGGFSAHNAYKTSPVSSASLTAPTNLVARASGNAIRLTWTVGATSGKTKQIVSVVRTGASTACAASPAFTALSTSLSTTTSTYTETTPTALATSQAGDWYCYQVATAYNTSWTKSGYVNAQEGFVASGLSLTTKVSTGSTTVSIDTATITVSFNQKIGSTGAQLKPTSSIGVCALDTTPNYELLIGVTKCKASAEVTFGRLKSSIPLSNKKFYTTATFTVHNTTTTHTYTVVVTFKATTPSTLTTFTGTPTWTFSPGTPTLPVLKSSTGTVTVCRTNSHATSLCQPSVSSKSL